MRVRVSITARTRDMNNFSKVKKEIRGRVKEVSRLYHHGDIDGGVFEFFVRMAMAQEIFLGFENTLV
jgi:hypothetical protein